MNTMQSNLKQVIGRIHQAEQKYGRPRGSVQLLAVSKNQPMEAIEAALLAGQTAFGESYLQEALQKIATLGTDRPEWHFIGPLQSNKTRKIAELFDWVHTVDRLKIALRLSEQRPTQLPPLNICLQVNISGEQSKSGISLEELPTLAAAVTSLPGLKLRGLMAIPAACDDIERQRMPFRQLREALETLNSDGFTLDTLSMGMSDDMEAAIAEGATLVRIGSALFGQRPPKASVS
jgi:pyridoxal phosphate enzyme (YggS family)